MNNEQFKEFEKLNLKALKMWHSNTANNSFDGQVIFNMDLFDDWYCECSPLEIVRKTDPGFNPDDPYLIIDVDNVAHSLTTDQAIKSILSIKDQILKEYKNFKEGR